MDMVGHQYDPLIGIWVKSKPSHIQTFIRNWEDTHEAQAFLVYDLPPMLPQGGLIFLHAIKENKLSAYAKYVGCEYIKGWSSDYNLWEQERNRIWRTYGNDKKRLHTHKEEEFKKFWEDQKGARGLFLMEEVCEVPKKVSWDEEKRILKIYRPIGFSYKYLTATQVREFLELIGINMEIEVKGIESPIVRWHFK
jgi:hypothetical protein